MKPGRPHSGAAWGHPGAAGEAGAAHPAAAFAAALATHGDALVAAGTLPAALHVFCLPSMPPLHLGLLQALAQCVDVQLYALNPCREYWLEVTDRRRLAYLAARAAPGEELHHEEGNRLLAAWGQQTKAQLELLIAATGDAVIDEAHFDEPEATTLLARVQRSMLDLTELAPGSIALAEDDRSIEVHVCHGLARELEVLHDRLLALFAAPQAPEPGEILVVTPDLEAAAPLIDAIFGTAPADRHIPFHVTGRGRSRVNPVARALLDLLALAGSRFAASAVFGLLQQAIVARRFGLAADDLAQVHAWLQAAGVHWALDAEHRASFDLPAQSRYSLADGLDRLYLGYALPTRIDAPFGASLPAGDAEGSDAVALGALWRFVGRLAALHRRVAAPLAATDWATLLTELLHDFIAPQGEEVEDLRETQTAIERFADELQRATPGQRVPLDVLRSALAAALDDAARGGVPTGAVTFASMSSLRNLPFKVVCAVGLNDGAFPTQARPAEYDLMARDPRPGDRQRRVDERNLFLDLLLAAREQLYLSYTGRSVRDNAPLPPSTLVSELLETLLPAIAGAREAAHTRLVVLHPLQGFAEPGFSADADPRLRSFDSDIAAALRQRIAQTPAAPTAETPSGAPDTPARPHDTTSDASTGTSEGTSENAHEDADEDDEGVVEKGLPAFFTSPLAPPGDEWCDVALADLIAFFGNPCRFLLGRRLGLALARPEEELQDDEPFIAGIPARSALAARLLPALCAGQGVDAVRALALAGAEVPAGAFGRHFLDRELAGLARFAIQLDALTAAPVLAPHASSVALTHDGRTWRVHAGFADLRASGLVRHRYDDVRARDLIEAWLHHLLLCADPPPGVAPRTDLARARRVRRARPLRDGARDAAGSRRALCARTAGAALLLPEDGLGVHRERREPLEDPLGVAGQRSQPLRRVGGPRLPPRAARVAGPDGRGLGGLRSLREGGLRPAARTRRGRLR